MKDKQARPVKKALIFLAALCVIIVGLFHLGGDTSHAAIVPRESSLYTEADINAAIRSAKLYFKLHFSGCTLTEIGYAGDSCNGDDRFIVLTSSFDVDSSGGDGSLNPDSTYTGWQWTLKRLPGGLWYHVDHGY